MQIQWDGIEDIYRGMTSYEQKVLFAIRQVATYFAPILEAYAKEHAPWTDRTGHARQRLFTLVEDLSKDTVVLYLAHGVEYGRFLEIRFAGRYQIVWTSIESHISEVQKMLDGIFK